jgi:APA family basic amino acid/polyamine antiporter
MVQLGLPSLALLVVANMIGAGVYTSSGFALGSLGTREAVLIAWLLAAIIACMGAVCYGGLVKQIAQSGGEAFFLTRFVHPFAGFLAGWISLTAGFSGAIAYSAITFESYLPKSAVLAQLPEGTSALAIVLFFGGLHYWGLSVGTRFQNGLVLLKLVLLLFFIGFGTWWLLGGTAAESLAMGQSNESVLDSEQASVPWNAWATSVMWISLSYAGYNAAIYVAGAAQAGGTVARSMLLATVGVTGIYLALNGVVLYSVPAEQLVNQQDVFKISAAALSGSWLERAVTGVILLSLATSVSAMLQIGPHVYSQMAKEGLLPKWLSWEEAGVPRRALLLQIVLAAGLAWLVNLQRLLDYLTFLLLISSAVTVGCLLLPSLRGKPGNRPVPLWPVLPAVFVLASFAIAGLSFHYRWSTDPWGFVFACTVLPLGMVMYPYLSRSSGE